MCVHIPYYTNNQKHIYSITTLVCLHVGNSLLISTNKCLILICYPIQYNSFSWFFKIIWIYAINHLICHRLKIYIEKHLPPSPLNLRLWVNRHGQTFGSLTIIQCSTWANNMLISSLWRLDSSIWKNKSLKSFNTKGDDYAQY